MAYKYALPGPPFDFLGHLCETQKKKFYEWLDKRTSYQNEYKQWYQIRSHQLRKTAGLLEEFYLTRHPDPSDPEPIKPTFEKEEWKVGKDGWFAHPVHDDRAPSVTVSRIKDRFRHTLQRDDESVYWMNWLRNHIERHEDKANMHAEAIPQVAQLRTELDQMFNDPQYQAVLVKNETELYTPKNGGKAEPYFRVHPLDEPTVYEKEHHAHNTEGRTNAKMTEGDL